MYLRKFVQLFIPWTYIRCLTGTSFSSYSVDASGSGNTRTGSRNRRVYEGLKQNIASETLKFNNVEYSSKMLVLSRQLK